MKKFKNILMLGIGRLIRLYIRYSICVSAKQFLWDRILSPFVNWREFNTIATTKQGIKFNIAFPDLIQERIYYFGVWEPNLTDYILKNLSLGDIFIDIGCNIGYFTCLASKIVGKKGRVYAIEASPSIYEIFLNNIKLNKISNVTTYNEAVYKEKATLSIYKADNTNIGKTTLLTERAKIKEYSEEIKIYADTLDNIIPCRDLFNAKFIKIDVEGAEWDVIEGIKNSLDKFSDHTEWGMEIAQGEKGNDIIKLFLKYGYQAYLLENNYSIESYIKNKVIVLKKLLILPIIEQVDVVFKKK